MFYKKAILNNFAIFAGKHLCWGLFLGKLQAFRGLQKRLRHSCFPVNYAKFLRTSILKNICGQRFSLYYQGIHGTNKYLMYLSL